jgi:hypothetical protein
MANRRDAGRMQGLNTNSSQLGEHTLATGGLLKRCDPRICDVTICLYYRCVCAARTKVNGQHVHQEIAHWEGVSMCTIKQLQYRVIEMRPRRPSEVDMSNIKVEVQVIRSPAKRNTEAPGPTEEPLSRSS